MQNAHTLKKEDLIKDLKHAGIPQGALLHLKVSMRSIGPLAGGAQTLLEALLETVGPQGTLVVDSFVQAYPLPLSPKNASIISTATSPSYAGAFANCMIKHPLSVRSQHPIQRFTAIGKLAHELMDGHQADSPAYQVFEQLIRLKALNLSIGRNTVGVGTTHVAIESLGLRKKIPPMGLNYRDALGQIKTKQIDWNGGCSRGFSKFIPLYEQAGCLKKIRVGQAEALLTSMPETFQVELEQLRQDPGFFFCDDPTCKDCQLNWHHASGSYLKVKFHSLLAIIRGYFNADQKH